MVRTFEFEYKYGQMKIRPVQRFMVYLLSEYNKRTDEWEVATPLSDMTDKATAKSIARHYRNNTLPVGSIICVNEDDEILNY